MNKKQLARAHKFASNKKFGLEGYYVKEPHTVGYKAGWIISVIKYPTDTDYGIFEVAWESETIKQPTCSIPNCGFKQWPMSECIHCLHAMETWIPNVHYRIVIENIPGNKLCFCT